MKDENMGSTWITMVLITVVAILVFLVFFGSKKGETALPPVSPLEQPVTPSVPPAAKPAEVKG